MTWERKRLLSNPRTTSPKQDEENKETVDTALQQVDASRNLRKAPAGIIQDFILDSLAYKSMRDREGEVTAAHGKTLEWIFGSRDRTQSASHDFGHKFTRWLSTDDLGPIYWITGKPGSGKSTLMRFLFQHQSTENYLGSWYGEYPGAKAGFFFWTSGSREQRSQSGLLRYLLHQLLSGNRDIMPATFPALWKKLSAMTTKERIQFSIDWSTHELMDAFQSFVDSAVPHMKICLFIDGLDEFDGDHIEIINFFKALGDKNGNRIKMCLSSRPWAVFEAAFQSSVPNLKLQELTEGDMLQYAKEHLSADDHFRRMVDDSNLDLADTLSRETVLKADGVFLWVRLAVDKILEYFERGHDVDGVTDLLRDLPTELDDLFEKLIFHDQTARQISETAALFQLIRAREVVADFIKDEHAASLTVWELAFATETEDDSLALSLPIKPISGKQVLHRYQSTRKQVKERFAGLLDEFSRPSWLKDRPRRFADDKASATDAVDNKVTYIHRTVRDWLVGGNTRVEQRLINSSPEDFDPHLRLLQSYIMRLKLPLDEPEQHRRLDEWWPDIALTLTHARYITCFSEDLHRRLINELDKTISWYWLPKVTDPSDHWARHAFGSFEVRSKAPPIQEPFLCLATKFSITRYVRDELDARLSGSLLEPGHEVEDNDEDREKKKLPTPLLSYATEFLCSRKKTIYPLSDPDLVKYLLLSPSHLNPGPNHCYTHFETRAQTTPWLSLLRHLRDADRRCWIECFDIDPQGTARWSEIVSTFMEDGGADVDAVVVADSWDPEITALGVMKMLEERYGAMEVKKLREIMESKQDHLKSNRQ
jgi:hypothetical protein